MQPQPRERRKNPRIQAEFPLRLGPDGSTPARLKNISRSGLCCVVPAPLPEMSLVQAAVEVPAKGGGHRKIRLEGAVVRCRPEPAGGFEIALFFQYPPPEVVEVITRYVAARLAAPDQPEEVQTGGGEG